MTVRGRLEESQSRLYLKIPGLEKAFRLLGDDNLQALRQRRGEWRQSVRIEGVLVEAEGEDATIRVESFQFGDDQG